MAVTRHGPSIGVFRERDIPSYIVTSDGAFHDFHKTTLSLEDDEGGVELAKLSPDECVIAPGLVYRRRKFRETSSPLRNGHG